MKAEAEVESGDAVASAGAGTGACKVTWRRPDNDGGCPVEYYQVRKARE